MHTHATLLQKTKCNDTRTDRIKLGTGKPKNSHLQTGFTLLTGPLPVYVKSQMARLAGGHNFSKSLFGKPNKKKEQTSNSKRCVFLGVFFFTT